MHRVKRQIDKEGLFPVSLDESAGFIAQCSGQVALVLFVALKIALHPVERVYFLIRLIGKIPTRSTTESIKLIKSTFEWMKAIGTTQMPFA